VAVAGPGEEGSWAFGAGEEVVGDGEAGDVSAEQGFETSSRIAFTDISVPLSARTLTIAPLTAPNLRLPSGEPSLGFIA
jgi:hypothetical protein